MGRKPSGNAVEDASKLEMPYQPQANAIIFAFLVLVMLSPNPADPAHISGTKALTEGGQRGLVFFPSFFFDY